MSCDCILAAAPQSFICTTECRSSLWKTGTGLIVTFCCCTETPRNTIVACTSTSGVLQYLLYWDIQLPQLQWAFDSRSDFLLALLQNLCFSPFFIPPPSLFYLRKETYFHNPGNGFPCTLLCQLFAALVLQSKHNCLFTSMNVSFCKEVTF